MNSRPPSARRRGKIQVFQSRPNKCHGGLGPGAAVFGLGLRRLGFCANPDPEPRLFRVVREWQREQREARVTPITGHVFAWKGKPMTEGWKTAFKAACRRARLEGLWFHDLRHT